MEESRDGMAGPVLSCCRLAGEESTKKEVDRTRPEGSATSLGKQQQQGQSGPFTWPVWDTQGVLDGFSRVSKGRLIQDRGVGYRVP